MVSDRTLLKRALLSIIPENNPWIYRYCKRYVDLYNGDNNGNIRTNGELFFMESNLPQCDTVFDIGANVGEWASLALGVNPNLNLHCFEPSQITYQKLQSNPFPQNVVCSNFGMSSECREAPLFLFEDCAGINSMYRRKGLESHGLSPQQREEMIQLDTVDHYCKEQGIRMIDFIKLDVEGHELEVFKGMAGMLGQGRVNTIQFEYGGCNIDAGVLLKDIFYFFNDFNYTFYKIYPKKIRLIDRYDQRLENFQYQNWAIVRNN